MVTNEIDNSHFFFLYDHEDKLLSQQRTHLHVWEQGKLVNIRKMHFRTTLRGCSKRYHQLLKICYHKPI